MSLHPNSWDKETSHIEYYTVKHSHYINVVVVMAARSPPSSCQVATGAGSALTLTVSVRLVFIITLVLPLVLFNNTGAAVIRSR